MLYSLPELDGAIDTVPLGGLVGDDIFLVPERVKRLVARLRKWVTLRRTPPEVRARHWGPQNSRKSFMLQVHCWPYAWAVRGAQSQCRLRERWQVLIEGSKAF